MRGKWGEKVYIDRLKAAIEESGEKDFYLALINPFAYNAMVKGKKWFKVNSWDLYKICKRYNVSADYLLGVSNSMNYVG